MDQLPDPHGDLLNRLLREMDFSGFHFKKTYRPEHLALRGEGGWTLLHYAAQQGHLGSAKLMLPEGAMLINALDDDGWSPAMLAANNWQAPMLRLFSPWIDWNLDAPGGRSLASLCAGDPESLRETIDHCDPRRLDAQGRSLLDHVSQAYENNEPDAQCLAMLEERLLRQNAASPHPHPRSRL